MADSDVFYFSPSTECQITVCARLSEFQDGNYLGKAVVVRSVSGPETTILNGSAEPGTIVLFFNEEGRGSVLDGFTLTGGTGHIPDIAASRGGAIYIRACGPTIRNNIFVDNHSTPTGVGGAIYLGSAASPTKITAALITNNVFRNNRAELGGAIAALWGDPVISDNQFTDNMADYDGAGIFIWMREGMVSVENNFFQGNEAQDHGGGLYISNTQNARGVIVRNNVIVHNTACGLGQGDTGSGGGIWTSGMGGVISNNTIAWNQGFGEALCGGGGIVLDGTPSDLVVSYNIIAFNNSCGISCRGLVEAPPATNLLWSNENGDLGTGVGVCPSGWDAAVVITDPYFCRFDDFSVAENSPALAGPVYGAFPIPGCGPVAVQPSTWGQLKVRYK